MAMDVSSFVAKRCEVEISSVPSVGEVSEKLAKSRRVVSKVVRLRT